MFRPETNGASTSAEDRDALARGMDTWLACSAADAAGGDRAKRPRPGPYTPINVPSPTPPPGGGDAGSAQPVADAHTPSATPPAPPATADRSPYAIAPASPIDLTGLHDAAASSPSWHLVSPPPPGSQPKPGPEPSPHISAHPGSAASPHPLPGMVVEATQVLQSCNDVHDYIRHDFLGGRNDTVCLTSSESQTQPV